MNEWNIQSRAHRCQECDRNFSDKETYHTILFDEKKSYQRLDVCQACWENQYGQGASDRKGFVSCWQGVYEVPPPPPPEPIRKEGAESLLRKLIELDDPKYGPAVYILSAMLERKRVLKVKEQIMRDDQRVFIYEQPKTGDVFTVTDPKLQLDQLDAVQHDVAELLEHGLNPPAESTAEPPSETEAADPASPAAAEGASDEADAPAADPASDEPVAVH